MRKIKQKLITGGVLLAFAFGCVATAFSAMPDKKVYATKANVLENYVTLSDEASSFEYKAFPEDYQKVHTSGSKSATETITGGMVFTAVNSNSAPSVSMTFSTVVSASRLKREFNLLEYLVLTDEMGIKSGSTKDSPPFNCISLTLASKNNPNNYVKISNYPSRYHNYASNIRAGTADMTPAGRDGKGNFYDSNSLLSGSGVNGSLSGCYKNAEGVIETIPSAVSYKFDTESMTAYAYPTGNFEDIYVRDFDNPADLLGLDKIFEGFESDELTATLSVDGLTGTAQIAVLGFNGTRLYGDTFEDIRDTNKPDVYATNYLEGVQAEVGVNFPIFQFKAYDDFEGLMDIDGYDVYYNYNSPSKEKIETSNDILIPTKSGMYTIVAYKEDSSGNKGEGIYTVEACEKLAPFSISLQGNIENTNTVGSYVELPSAVVIGGTVGLQYTVRAFYGNEQIQLDINNGFTLKKQGLYVIKYSVFDYRNVPYDFEYYIEATIEDKPIVEFPNMPSYVAVGNKITIPEFEALDWISYPGLASEAIISATVTKGNNAPIDAGKEYTVESAGEFTYTLTATTIRTNKSVSKSYTITAIDCAEVADYFVTDDVTIGEIETDNTVTMLFEANAEGGTTQFINPLLASNFGIRFIVPKDYTNFSNVSIVLSDKNKGNEQVTINCFNGKIDFCDKTVLVSSSFGRADYNIGIKDLNLTNNGESLGLIETYDNGKKFEGFSSGYVYVSVKFNGIIGKAGLQMKNLCGHTDFTVDATDNSRPTLNMTNEIPSMYKIGEVVSIPETFAYDVFDGECVVNIQVTKEGIKIPLTEDNKFVVTEYGKYILRFETKDKSGNRNTIAQNLYCKNYNGPTITVLNKVATSGKVGSTIKIAPATATDYFGENVKVNVFVLKMGGEYVEVDDNDTFKIDEATEYVIWYTARDDEYNFTSLKFVVKGELRGWLGL